MTTQKVAGDRGNALLEAGSRRVRVFSRIGAIGAGFLLLLATGIILVDVFARLLFSVSVGGADEFGSYALAVGSGWAFAHALLVRAHIRIDSFTQLLPVAARRLLHFLGLLAFALFFWFLTYKAAGVVQDSYRFNSRAQTAFAMPLVYPQLMWLAGLVLTSICFLVMLAEAVAAFFVSGRYED